MQTPGPRTAAWRKSSYSGQNGSCVELANDNAEVGVRDSKNIVAGVLRFDSVRWNAFLAEVSSGRIHR